ncbi:MAG: RNA-guided pseudouridylation complex pseudouridine synthase subunit Cbf5 [Thermoplasmata archaeon]|nr:RNA-guided pseudouridylation complex pseudouridine synthase subunit Cbf5 [Thermoplasmata archaeon]
MSEAPISDPGIAGRLATGAFLLVDKPRGPSSHQVTAWVRDILGVERAGHAGTLDPNVSGLLWVGLGPALKLLPLLLEFPKRYVGLISFHSAVAPRDLDRVVAEFTAPIYQTPPVRSAVRRERRVRRIHRLDVLERTKDTALVDLVVDSGTYVRTLAVDLGDALGVGGNLVELRRSGTGPFREDQSVTLSGLADAATRARAGDAATLGALLHPMEEVWKEFPVVRLRASAAAAVAHGAGLAKGGIIGTSRPYHVGASVVLVGVAGELVAFGAALRDSEETAPAREGWVIQPDRVFVDPRSYPTPWKPARGPASTSPTGSGA